MSRRSVRYRRSPYVVSYWSDERLVFHNYATGIALNASTLAAEILDCLSAWRPATSVCQALPRFTPSSLNEALEILVEHTLLQRSDREPHSQERAMKTWASWHPAAGFFHFSTKDPPYEKDEAVVGRFLLERLRQKTVPPPLKSYPGAPVQKLPAAGDGTGGEEEAFSRVLMGRRTWRKFSRRPLDLGELGTLLERTFGVQQWLDLGKFGRLALKTSPSGGGRHPIEAYVLARRVRGLMPGLHHYDPAGHRLQLIRPGASRRDIEAYLPGQPWYRPAPFLLLMTAVFSRMEWKYPYPRVYRSILLEAGHFCQTFCLVATSLGLAPFCTANLADSRIERDLGLDGVTESVLYAAGAGNRPKGSVWSPSPDGRAVPSLVAPRRSRKTEDA